MSDKATPKCIRDALLAKTEKGGVMSCKRRSCDGYCRNAPYFITALCIGEDHCDWYKKRYQQATPQPKENTMPNKTTLNIPLLEEHGVLEKVDRLKNGYQMWFENEATHSLIQHAIEAMMPERVGVIEWSEGEWVIVNLRKIDWTDSNCFAYLPRHDTKLTALQEWLKVKP